MQCKFDFLYFTTHLPSTYVEVHKHNCYELVYYVKGSGVMNLNGDILQYQPHSITLTRPTFFHDERHTTETEVIFIGFTYCNHPISLANGIYQDGEELKILQLLRQMKQELMEKNAFYKIKLDLLTQEIIIELERSGKHIAKTVELDKLLYVKSFIDENFNQKLDLQTLADLSGYSYDYFRHLFKVNTGYSPVQYQIRKRVEQASFLLSNTDQTITTIAMNCGFSTTSQFGKLFKELTGEQPSVFRSKSNCKAFV